MTDINLILETLKRSGRMIAESVQNKSGEITATALNAERDYIPSFKEACKSKNMINRKFGFVCKSSAGRVVKLIQPYDSEIYPAEPEELPAQWGFVWSTDPAHALPFIALSTSPYNTGDCCTVGENVYRSTMDNNVWPPSAYPEGWEVVKA